MTAPATLEIQQFRDGEYVGSRLFTARDVTIGRAARSMLRLEDPSVSPEHAVIRFTGRVCLIEDLGSRTGIVVGGRKVSAHLVQIDDELVIGPFALRLVIHEAEAAAEA